MTYRKEALVEGEYYHIYNRGNSKQNIFTDDLDRDRFTKLLYLCNSEKSINFRDDIVGKKIDAFDFNRGEELVSIGAWVLMPNHFHLYISPRRRLGEKVKVVFTGDTGNSPAPLLRDTEKISDADYLIIDSVYGDKNHEPKEERDRKFRRIVMETIETRGALIIPALFFGLKCWPRFFPRFLFTESFIAFTKRAKSTKPYMPF